MQFILWFVALFFMSSLALGASDLPKRKSGLWEIKISNSTGKGAQAMQQCIDEKTDDLTKNNMAATEKQSCSKNQMRREGDKLVAESICKFDGSTAKTRAVFTGKFDSAYKADIKSTYEPPLHGMRESSAVIDAKWLGSCKPGQRPGDISIPGMPNINMNDMRKGPSK
ncbi:MAG TPA: DUF3617 family protein [Candidatus Binatia bacterium]|jgi:hypothetical protein